MNEFELTLRLKNNLVKRRRVELGLSVRQAAEAAGVSYGLWLDLEGLKVSPLDTSHRAVKHGAKWRPSAVRMAVFLGCQPEELFPDVIVAVKAPTVVKEIKASEALALAGYAQTLELPGTPEAALLSEEMRRDVNRALKTISPREELVLRLRMDRTLDEVAAEFGVTRERIRQIEAKALRKLRHPSRTKLLEEHR